MSDYNPPAPTPKSVTVVFQLGSVAPGGYNYQVTPLAGSGTFTGSVSSTSSGTFSGGASYSGFLYASGHPSTYLAGSVTFSGDSTLIFGPLLTVLEDG